MADELPYTPQTGARALNTTRGTSDESAGNMLPSNGKNGVGCGEKISKSKSKSLAVAGLSTKSDKHRSARKKTHVYLQPPHLPKISHRVEPQRSISIIWNPRNILQQTRHSASVLGVPYSVSRQLMHAPYATEKLQPQENVSSENHSRQYIPRKINNMNELVCVEAKDVIKKSISNMFERISTDDSCVREEHSPFVISLIETCIHTTKNNFSIRYQSECADMIGCEDHIECAICKQQIKFADMKGHLITCYLKLSISAKLPGSSTYQCVVCRRKFRSLDKHFHDHASPQAYQCKFCKRVCLAPFDLRQHLADHVALNEELSKHMDICETSFCSDNRAFI